MKNLSGSRKKQYHFTNHNPQITDKSVGPFRDLEGNPYARALLSITLSYNFRRI